MLFQQEIKSFLQEQQLLFSEKNPFSVQSGFPFLVLKDHPVVLHCIPVHPVQYPHLFSQLNDEALTKKVRLVHLWEDVWYNYAALVKMRLTALCGKATRVYARQAEVVRLDKEEADTFLTAYHLQQPTTAYYKYGLYYKEELIAVATFSKSRIMKDGPALYRSYELVRFANRKDMIVTGGLSKLLTFFINQHHPAHIMTYADRDWGAGEGYQKIGFKLVEHTPPQDFLIHPKQLTRFYPHRLPSPFTSESDMIKEGFVKIYNAGNSKFILDRRNL